MTRRAVRCTVQLSQKGITNQRDKEQTETQILDVSTFWNDAVFLKVHAARGGVSQSLHDMIDADLDDGKGRSWIVRIHN